MAASSNSKTIARLAVRNTVWVALGTYLNIAIGFVSNLVLTRLLSPEIYGFFSMGQFWSGLLNVRAKAGLNYAAIQRQETDGDLLGTYFALNLVLAGISVALSVVAVLVMPLLGYAYPVALATVVLMAADGITALVSPLAIVLEKELQLSRPALMGLAASVVAYAIAIGLAVRGAGLWSLLATIGITNVITLGSTYWICKRRVPGTFHLHWQFSSRLARQLLRTGVPTGLSVTAVMTIVSTFDNFLVGTYVGYATLGFYDRAYRIAHWSNLLLITTVARIAFVTFAKVQNDLPRLTHAVRLSLWLLLTLGLPIVLVVFFGASDIVYLFYGPKWAASAAFLRILVIYAMAAPFVELSIWLSTARGDTLTTMLITGVEAITIIVVATPLTWRFGAMGTVAGVGITSTVGLVLSCRYVFQQVPLKFGEVFAAPLLAAAIATGVLIILWNMPSFASHPPLMRLVLTGTLGSSTFLATLFILRPRETLERLRYIGQTWRKAPATQNDSIP